MEPEYDLFSREQSKRAIQKVLGKLSSFQAGDEFEQERNRHINLILNSMLSSPGQWNTSCTINIKWFGEQFISTLSDDKDITSKEFLDDVFSMCFRFLLELYFAIKGDFTIEYEQARRFASTKIDLFTVHAKTQIEFAMQDMPIGILKMLLTHDKIDSIKDFNKIAENADRMKSEWNKEIEEKANAVNQLKENLEKYKAAFNFVGLYQGFDDLTLVKYKEKSNALKYLILFGFLIVSPMISEIVFILLNFDKIVNSKTTLIVLLVPTVSLVVVLVYYFRILLVHFNSVKSQILQLELRKTLCKFIQNYVDYSTEIKKKDKDSLAKFENIVFSGLVTSDEKMPSTFDGVEQLVNLIKSVKS